MITFIGSFLIAIGTLTIVVGLILAWADYDRIRVEDCPSNTIEGVEPLPAPFLRSR
jgi:hypothetical protein